MSSRGKIGVIRTLLDQVVSDTTILSSQFKTQIAVEEEVDARDIDFLVVNRKNVCTSMNTKWDQIKENYSLLIEHMGLEADDGQLYVQNIQRTIGGMSSGNVAFKVNEFRFIPQVLKLITHTKELIRLYIESNASEELKSPNGMFADLSVPASVIQAKTPNISIPSSTSETPISQASTIASTPLSSRGTVKVFEKVPLRSYVPYSGLPALPKKVDGSDDQLFSPADTPSSPSIRHRQYLESPGVSVREKAKAFQGDTNEKPMERLATKVHRVSPEKPSPDLPKPQLQLHISNQTLENTSNVVRSSPTVVKRFVIPTSTTTGFKPPPPMKPKKDPSVVESFTKSISEKSTPSKENFPTVELADPVSTVASEHSKSIQLSNEEKEKLKAALSSLPIPNPSQAETEKLGSTQDVNSPTIARKSTTSGKSDISRPRTVKTLVKRQVETKTEHGTELVTETIEIPVVVPPPPLKSKPSVKDVGSSQHSLVEPLLPKYEGSPSRNPSIKSENIELTLPTAPPPIKPRTTVKNSNVPSREPTVNIPPPPAKPRNTVKKTEEQEIKVENAPLPESPQKADLPLDRGDTIYKSAPQVKAASVPQHTEPLISQKDLKPPEIPMIERNETIHSGNSNVVDRVPQKNLAALEEDAVSLSNAINDSKSNFELILVNDSISNLEPNSLNVSNTDLDQFTKDEEPVEAEEEIQKPETKMPQEIRLPKPKMEPLMLTLSSQDLFMDHLALLSNDSLSESNGSDPDLAGYANASPGIRVKTVLLKKSDYNPKVNDQSDSAASSEEENSKKTLQKKKLAYSPTLKLLRGKTSKISFNSATAPTPVFTSPDKVGSPDSDREIQQIKLFYLRKYEEPCEYLRVLFVPLNGLFNMFVGDLTHCFRFGRNNADNYQFFLTFPSLVVSRSHMEIYQEKGKIFIKDIGSNSGTFLNNERLSPAGKVSDPRELKTGDYIQLGKDYLNDVMNLDENGRVQIRKRCVRFQVVIIPPHVKASKAVTGQPIPIEQPVNRGNSISMERNPDVAVKETVFTDSETGQLAGSPSLFPPNLPESPVIASPTEQKPVFVAEKIQYIISQTVNGNKTTKLTFQDSRALPMLQIDLTHWESQCRLSVTLPSQRKALDIFPESKPGAKSPTKLKAIVGTIPWTIEDSKSGRQDGRILFQNEIKMEIFPANPREKCVISVTGDFKECRMIVTQKWEQTREQKLIGEAKGRHQTKKSMREANYLTNFELIDGELHGMVVGSIILTNLLFGNAS